MEKLNVEYIFFSFKEERGDLKLNHQINSKIMCVLVSVFFVCFVLGAWRLFAYLESLMTSF